MKLSELYTEIEIAGIGVEIPKDAGLQVFPSGENTVVDVPTSEPIHCDPTASSVEFVGGHWEIMIDGGGRIGDHSERFETIILQAHPTGNGVNIWKG